MAIQRKPKSNTNNIDIKSVENFIDGASNTVIKPSQKKINKVPVALRFDHKLLADIDEMANKRGMSRNSIISYWCSKGVESE